MATQAPTVGHNKADDIEISYHDFLRTGPGTIAGRYLRSYWQPVYRSEDVKVGQAKPVKVFCEEYALYRGQDGKARLVQPRCAHRGAKLSVGWVVGNDIQCAYHAWAYNGDTGQCTKQPAEPKPFCEQVHIRTYPVHEYLGLVFAYLGEGAPPPFPRSPEFENDKYLTLLTVDTWPANYWAQLENSIDYAHTEFLHWHFNFHTPQKVNVDETEYGVKVFVPGLSETAFHYDTMYFVMPNTHEWAGPPGKDPTMGNFARSWRIPKDDESHIRFDLRVYPFDDKNNEAFKTKVMSRVGDKKEGYVGDISQQIIDGKLSFQDLKDRPELGGGLLTTIQDCTVQASLGPMATREHSEMLGQTDLAIALLRRLWKTELQAFAAGRPLRDWKRPNSLWEALDG